MMADMYEQEIISYLLFGIILNFVFSFAFGIFLSKNIGVEEMIQSKGDKVQSPLIAISLLIPYLKMIITLYRVAILQLYFLNKGRSYKEFWIYMTHNDQQ